MGIREKMESFLVISNEVNGIKEPPYYEAGDIIWWCGETQKPHQRDMKESKVSSISNTSHLGDLDLTPLGDAPTKETNSHASQKYFTPGKIFE